MVWRVLYITGVTIFLTAVRRYINKRVNRSRTKTVAFVLRFWGSKAIAGGCHRTRKQCSLLDLTTKQLMPGSPLQCLNV